MSRCVLMASAVVCGGGTGPRPRPNPAGPLLTCPETPIIHQVCSVGTAVPNLLADGVEGVAGGVLGQLTEWVVAGAKSVVGFVGQSIDSSTRPDVNASWYEPNYQLMLQVGGAFLLPLVLLAALWSLLRHDAGGGGQDRHHQAAGGSGGHGAGHLRHRPAGRHHRSPVRLRGRHHRRQRGDASPPASSTCWRRGC